MKLLAHLLAHLRALAAAALLSCVPLTFAGSTPWPEAPYSYFADNAKLEAVLADFASGFSLSLALQPNVTGVVNGRFATRTPTEFITKLGGVYGFVWHTHAGTLFISRASDIVTRGVAAPGGNVGTMRKALEDLGVLDHRFGWGELGDPGVAVISGPPSYVGLIESTIRNLPPRSQQLMVFRLQHASAGDRTVNYRDQQLLTPGLASILRTMVADGGAGHSGSPSSGGGLGLPMRQASPLGESAGGNAEAGTARSASRSAISPSAAVRGPQPSVQADPRLNAVIIQDLPERLPLYQQLIAQLDVPTSLVEIEAMIIDISTDRASELGVAWSGRIGKLGFGFGKPSTTPGVGTIGFTSGSTAAGDFLISQLHALESNGDAEVQSRPSVLTSENLAALLDLSETFYIRSEGERVANVVPVTTGTTLRVTPHVLQQDGRAFVQLKIDIEDGQITDRQVDSLPTVTRSTVSTEATVLHGEALLIAGHTTRRELSAKQQVPFLGDIPGVGLLFSNKTRTVQKRERLFLIRPKVVGLPGQPVASVPAPEVAAPR